MELKQIGASHARIKQVIDIQKNKIPSRHGFFVAEGLWAHNLLISTGVEIESFLWCPELLHSDQARKRSVEIAGRAGHAYRVSAKTMERIAERDVPDGMVSVAVLPHWSREDVALRPDALVLVADAIEIPGNLGTLIRTLDACDADCLVLTNRRTRMTHPKVFRGSQGMSLTVPTVEFEAVTEAITWLIEQRFSVYLADTDEAGPYRGADYRGRTAVVVGNERYGISRPWYEHGFDRIAIPMLGRSDSLNVAISASVLLYEARARKSGW